MKRSAIRAWLAAWPGGALIGVANGVLREATYGKRVGEQSAHRISGITAITAFGLYFSTLQRRWPLASTTEAAVVGAAWLSLTVAFEFGFGRAVAKQSWEELLADYNVAGGRTWPFVLAAIAGGPAVVQKLQQGP